MDCCYEVELSVTRNQRWRKIFCEINLGGQLYPTFFHFNVLSLVSITEKAQNSMNKQLTEQSCVLGKNGMSKRPREVATLKKHFEPITLECATSTLNTLYINFLNTF